MIRKGKFIVPIMFDIQLNYVLTKEEISMKCLRKWFDDSLSNKIDKINEKLTKYRRGRLKCRGFTNTD